MPNPTVKKQLKHRPFKQHFNQINSALKKEKELKDKLAGSLTNLRLNAESDLTKDKIFKTILFG